MRRGLHTLHWWSRKQACVALSSCEGEVNALVKGLSESLLLNSICELFREGHMLEMFTDSSAAKGVVTRAGSGKLKHLCCKQLWIQEFVAEGRVTVNKVPREISVADALTHEWRQVDGHFFSTLGFSQF